MEVYYQLHILDLFGVWGVVRNEDGSIRKIGNPIAARLAAQYLIETCPIVDAMPVRVEIAPYSDVVTKEEMVMTNYTALSLLV